MYPCNKSYASLLCSLATPAFLPSEEIKVTLSNEELSSNPIRILLKDHVGNMTSSFMENKFFNRSIGRFAGKRISTCSSPFGIPFTILFSKSDKDHDSILLYRWI